MKKFTTGPRLVILVYVFTIYRTLIHHITIYGYGYGHSLTILKMDMNTHINKSHQPNVGSNIDGDIKKVWNNQPGSWDIWMFKITCVVRQLILMMMC